MLAEVKKDYPFARSVAVDAVGGRAIRVDPLAEREDYVPRETD
jgi:hypothetical protein